MDEGYLHPRYLPTAWPSKQRMVAAVRKHWKYIGGNLFLIS